MFAAVNEIRGRASHYKTCAAALVALTLAACGGGGVLQGPTLTGTLMDGYISGATVCLPLKNSNGVCDPSDPQQTTGTSGSFSLKVPYGSSIAGKHLVAVITAGVAHDADDLPASAVSKTYTLMAPAETPSIVSPLTTMVSLNMMVKPASSVAEAQAKVQSDLGVPAGAITADYIANPPDNKSHYVAKLVAAMLAGTIAGQSPTTDNLGSALDAVKAGVVKLPSSPGAVDLKNAIEEGTKLLPAGGSTGACGNASNTGSGTVLASFDGTPLHTDFGGAGSSIALDPANASNKVLDVQKPVSANSWAGTTLWSGTALDFSAAKNMTANVCSPAIGVHVRLKLEDSANSQHSVETEAVSTKANSWETLTFNFASAASGTPALNLAYSYNKASVFFDFGLGSDTGVASAPMPALRNYYFDNLRFAGGTLTVPGAPAVASVSAGNAQATLVITAPASDGGSAITGYTVTSTPSGGVDSNAGTTALTHQITGLTNGVVYSFKVHATNAIGSSAESAASNSVTPALPPASPTAPGVPLIGTASAGNALATVAFTAPASDGGSAITGYTVSSVPSGGVDSNAGSTLLSHTMTGLSNGIAYTFTVHATNSIGNSIESAASNSVMPVAPLLTFASGFTSTKTTAQGGTWGYVSGDFTHYTNTYAGGDYAPAIADASQDFWISVITSAPSAPAPGATPPTAGGYVGMYVTYPGNGLTLNGQTSLLINLGVDANFYKQVSNRSITVSIVGAQTYTSGINKCNATVTASVNPTSSTMIGYTIPLSSFTLSNGCGSPYSGNYTTAAAVLAQPIGAVNSQLIYPNINTTIISGAVYPTGIARGLTQFQ